MLLSPKKYSHTKALETLCEVQAVEQLAMMRKFLDQDAGTEEQRSQCKVDIQYLNTKWGHGFEYANVYNRKQYEHDYNEADFS